MIPIDPTLPAAPGLTAMELTPSDEPLLQRFFVENPLYFLAVHGRPAEPLEAHEEINEPLAVHEAVDRGLRGRRRTPRRHGQCGE